MDTNTTNPAAEKKKRKNLLFHAARTTSIVSGIFCLSIAVLLGASFIRDRLDNFIDSPEIAALKTQHKENPQDAQIKETIRDADLTLRKEYFSRIHYFEFGALLLAGGLAVFLLTFKAADSLQEKQFILPSQEREPEYETKRRTFYSLAIGGISLAALSWIFALATTNVLYSEKEVIPPFPSEEEIGNNWPRFRGPGGLGVAPDQQVPTSWDIETGKNIVWKTPLPAPAPAEGEATETAGGTSAPQAAAPPSGEPFLLGESSPVIWRERLFFTGASAKKREVYCFDTRTGTLIWRNNVGDIPREAKKPLKVMKSYYAVCTPATDGRRVYAIFSNGDVAAFDMEGKRVWAKNLGLPKNPYCHASSLALYKELLLIQYDQGYEDEDLAKLLALDTQTGRKVWQTPRDSGTSWSTPIVIHPEINGKKTPQIITCANPWVIAYTPATGKEIWRADCLSGEVAPGPIFSGGIVYAVNAGAYLNAIKPDGRGDVSKTHILWQGEDGLPDIASPVACEKHVYLVASDGWFTCHSKETGELVWETELDRSVEASPGIAGGIIYIFCMKGEEGEVVIAKAGDEFEEVGRINMKEGLHASPVFLNNRLYIRGTENLYCIGATGNENNG